MEEYDDQEIEESSITRKQDVELFMGFSSTEKENYIIAESGRKVYDM